MSRRSLLGAAALCVAGCSGRPQPPGDPVAGLITAFDDRDAMAFRAAFAPTPRAQTLMSRVWNNWHGHRDARIVRVGERLAVEWPAGLSLPSRDLVEVDVIDGRIADLRGLSREPLWLKEAAEMGVNETTTAAVVTHAAALTQVSRSWLPAAETAVERLSAAGVSAAFPDWPGVLVIEVPLDDAAFASVTRGVPGATATAAVTIRPDAAALPRVVINPLFGNSFDATSAAGLVTHEGVHVALASVWDELPAWASEGFAEALGAQDGMLADRNRSLLEPLRGRAASVTLPSDEEFDKAEGRDLETAYAVAGLAMSEAARRHGRPALARWLARWGDPGRPTEAQFTAWLREALAAR